MKKMNNKGFTIVELVIVIAVIAILAAVMIPTFSRVVTNAQESAALQKAKAAWMSQQNSAGADAAGEWLSQILPEATCYPEAVELYNEIKKKVLDDWKWEMKKYEDALDLEKRKLATEDKRVSAWKEVGVAYGQNQQPVTTHVNWLR